MKRWRRLLKHHWLDGSDLRRVLDDAALARLTEQVRASERGHGGEIRVCIEAGLPLSYLLRAAPPRERALALFGKLRVWDTEHNNGVLVYLLLADRAIEIVADRGLNRHVDAAAWQALAARMRALFRDGRFEEGLAAAIAEVDGLLRRHFALAAGERNPNELPDRPVVIG